MSYEVNTNGTKRILKIDCENCKQNPSIAENPACLEDVIRGLESHANIDRVLLDGRYVREYNDEDISLLKEFIRAHKSSRYLALRKLTPNGCTDCREKRKTKIMRTWDEIKRDPKGELGKLKQWVKELDEKSGRGAEKCKTCRKEFLEKGLKRALTKISDNRLIEKFEPKGNRRGYEELFHPTTRPSFLRSKLKLKPPNNAELVDAYEVDETQIRIFYSRKNLEYLYFLIPPEYRLEPEEVKILQEVKLKLLDRGGDLNPKLARKEIENESLKLLMEASLEKNLNIKGEKIGKLAKSLAKFSAGLGVIETLIADPKIQDIYVDAPIGENPVHIYHQDFEECLTNIFLTSKDAQVLTSRFRAISGRPFSEANPTLDLNFEGVRITAIQEPLSPEGMALAIRRHKSAPWTLPLFVKKNFLTAKAAGLLSLLVDSQASLLITGSRGAGKTSLLGALMLELLPKYRIICLEDTAELPVEKLRKLGYRTQRLQVKPSISGSKVEMTTEDALRTALRLGESVFIVGEVRGPETRSLYEAMRVGAAGNSVMGTIHGSSTKDVFERVVYDLGIPPTSFKATDAIVVASPIRKKGSINRVRRLTQIAEVGESWREDPTSEDGIRDLMAYDPEDDELKDTRALEGGKSALLKFIGKKWSLAIPELKENLELRSRIQKTLVETANSAGRPELLEAKNVVKSNLTFHHLLEEELESGKVSYERVFSRWKDWLEGAGA